MHYSAIRSMVSRTFEKAGIRKKCNPHAFRHSRATYMANHLTEFQMNQYFGWIQGSDMPSTYVHMSGREVDDAILAMNGLKSKVK
ncbi:tyrosine-type recombinase/integrase, partial [Candidatus Woesearchaeota archaeon]|nr:tyrosine-type recombinase/integrase [Candidatus Woesearchaeota archaeon]